MPKCLNCGKMVMSNPKSTIYCRKCLPIVQREIDRQREVMSTILDDAKREMFGDDADLLPDDMGAK